MFKLILNILLTIYSLNLFAASDLLIINKNDCNIDPTNHIFCYTDSTLSDSFDTISDSLHAPLFTASNTRLIHYPASNLIHWFRFKVVNLTDYNSWFLDIDYAPFNKVIIFIQDNKGNIDTLIQSGIEVPSEYYFQDKTFINCLLPLKKGKIYQVYIRVQTSAYLLLPVSIVKAEDLIQKSVTKNRFLFFFFGVLIAIIFFNIFLFILTQENLYLLFSMMMILLLFTGFFQYGVDIISSLNPFLKIRIRILLHITFLMTFNVFSIWYLELNKYRLLHLIFKGCIVFYISYLLLIILPIVDNSRINLLTPYIFVFSMCISLAAGIFVLLNHNRNAIFYILFSTPFFISSFIWLMFLNNVFPMNLFTKYFGLFVFASFSLLITVKLTKKINGLKIEKEKASYFQSLNKELQFEIEERISAETALRESEKKFKLLFDLSPQPILVTDITTGKVEEISSRMLELSGYKYDEIIGKTTLDVKFIDPNTINKLLSEIEEKGKSHELEISLTTPENKVIDFVLHSEAISIKGKKKLLTLFSDVSNTKLHMNILKQSEQKMREINTSKDKFYALLSHDLINPFNALLGFSNLLVDALNNNEKNESIEYANLVRQSSELIFNLLQNILMWSKTQNGKIFQIPIMVYIDVLIADTLAVLLPVAKNKEINIQLELEENLRAIIDYNMIGTVIRNLVSNAIKFTEKGGAIILTANIRNHKLNITISDTGTGIDEQCIQRLFRLDKRYSLKGTNNELGTGFGLIICKEFIDIHNGRICAESIPGKGSKFSFSIPDGIE